LVSSHDWRHLAQNHHGVGLDRAAG
jgi:hypothetical protein